MNQSALTIVVPIEGPELSALRTLLSSIGDEVQKGSVSASKGAQISFAELSTTHFARFVVLEPPHQEPQAPPQLVFATCYDGPRSAHLKELVEVAGDALLKVFAHCVKDLSSKASLRTFLERHSVECEAFYVGHRGRSVSQIRDEARLCRKLESGLGEASGLLAGDPFSTAQRFVKEDPDLCSWALDPPARTRLPWSGKLALWVPTGLAVLALAPLMPFIRVKERREARRATARMLAHPKAARDLEIGRKDDLRRDEDRSTQNQMTLVTDVKPGFLRLLTLRLVLRVVDHLGRIYFDQGRLGDIQSIHFARWFLVKQGRRRLVFFSNYDGSWETYLGAFIDGASKGVTGIWSNTVGFPASRWLLWSGARRELKFKRWVRGTQVPTQVWYSAYSDLSVSNVQNNSEIRKGLIRESPGIEERRAWLRRL